MEAVPAIVGVVVFEDEDSADEGSHRTVGPDVLVTGAVPAGACGLGSAVLLVESAQGRGEVGEEEAPAQLPTGLAAGKGLRRGRGQGEADLALQLPSFLRLGKTGRISRLSESVL